MYQNVLHIDGTAGTLILAWYVVGGLVAIAAGCLPGNATGYRVLCVVVGLALAGWSTKVLLLGGEMILNLTILLVPVTLTANAIRGTYRAYRPQRPTTPLRPHPATRTYTEPPSSPPAPFPTAMAMPTQPVPPFAAAAPAHAVPPFAAAAPLTTHVPAAVSAHAASSHAAHLEPVHAAPSHTVPAVPAHAALATSVHAVSSHAGSSVHAAHAAQLAPRFHGHAIAPPATFPTPPRFAPQPLHNVPSQRSAPDGYVTVHAQYPANHLQPSPRHPSSHSAAVSHGPTLGHAPTWQPAAVRSLEPSWAEGSVEGERVPVRRQHVTSSHAGLPATRMPLAPMTDPSPLQPSAVRARHRAAGSAD